MEISISIFLRLFLSTIFFISASMKLFSVEQVKRTIRNLGFNDALWILIVIVEYAIAGILLVDNYYYFLFFIALLLIFFLFLNIKTMLEKKNIKCNCFGDFSNESFGIHTIFRIMLLLSSVLYLIYIKDQSRVLELPFLNMIAYSLLFTGILISYLLISTIINSIKT
ncbi:hypothetical protein P9E76_21490 [Schinkia azotoformans]|uniref:Methylamine utilisation protein MauE domain-containing protein n=1 Tax=Schinkia azotoformans LMG 9581 TaxID=1131731 RepID=K6EBH6_SCHAZ|nr:MauE/DoxX family redox-associated membrane protein [Schinkia azotoformans]EKN70786.1 hypothetical protein BAZO_00845 [Schinkia azotoformans LMG 9581]MEC1641099.1 hypothetical protein [Schinkia azotoformans]MEC1947568.1 hypothetical protein [Schinkia azotoformans]MED4354939.1 hypothetical protein [Schinkia azotoformans]